MNYSRHLRLTSSIATTALPLSAQLVYIPNIVTVNSTMLVYPESLHLVQAIIMFALSTVRCVRYVFASQWRSMPFLSLFLRDGVLWFMSSLGEPNL